MNTYIAKKMGEVLAFSRVAQAMMDKGSEGFLEFLTQEELEQLKEENERHESEILSITTGYEVKSVTEEKAEATQEKLEHMQNSYLTDEEDWKDPMELCEWSGFFHGGAMVHWSLLQGAANKLDDADLELITNSGYAFHEEMVAVIAAAIEELGEQASAGTQ